MQAQSTTTLLLAKENFKFSAAHFLIFDEKKAEKLHGHNYQVRVEIEVPSQQTPQQIQSGYFIDFNVFKKAIKSRLDQWDEVVLLPAKHPDMKFQNRENSLEVHFRERFYVFPQNEVILLPITNTSVEQLSGLLAQEFLQNFSQYGIVSLKVTVEETHGQGARCFLKI